MKTYDDGQIRCMCTAFKGLKGITYILAPVEIKRDNMERWAHDTDSNIVVVEGMDWNRDLTPWPQPAIAAGTESFGGEASQFLDHLEREFMPAVEQALGSPRDAERSLVGISLSGLFALWAWAQTDLFANVCSLSGSLWYPGFVDWMQGRELSGKDGRLLFLLGEREVASHHPVFGSVGAATSQISEIAKSAGADARMQIVEGDHHSALEPRLAVAMDFLAKKA